MVSNWEEWSNQVRGGALLLCSRAQVIDFVCRLKLTLFMSTRRDFLRSAILGASASVLGRQARADHASSGITSAVFTKHFLGLSRDHLADALAEIGVTAIEAPIRPKGHVEPERVVDELPGFVETLKQRGIEITLLSSGINAVSKDQSTERVLRTAKALGIPRYRMNWYSYDLKRPIWPQLDEIRPKLKDLVAFSKEVGILPCYQNHSGRNYVGAPVWDMALLMRDYKPSELAWCFDIMHATIEGSLSWPVELNLVRDHICVANFKNFRWEGRGHKDVPLGDGVVGKDYVDMLKATNFSGPMSLHVEYLQGNVKDEGYLPKAIAATRRDLNILKSWWE
jgi:sugar phosphate isomerase/epimerase